jgi:hypothetical protein
MTPYARMHVSERDFEIFSQIRRIVERLPDFKFDNKNEDIVSCHMLARALKTFFPVRVCDGYFCGSYQHSWLRTEDGSYIDVYPVATLGGPILIAGTAFCSLGHKLYKTRRYKGRFSKPEFKAAVKEIREEIVKILSIPELR